MITHSTKKLILNSSKGFTLVETLVALVILTVALVPILTLSSSASRVSISLQDNLISSGLAQEGVEVIRAIRDTNWFNGNPFNLGLGSDTIGVSTDYRVEWNSTSNNLSSIGTQPLNLNNGRYTYSGGSITKFSRTITITKINAGELRVVSQVTWQSRYSISKSVTAESHLFNWK